MKRLCGLFLVIVLFLGFVNNSNSNEQWSNFLRSINIEMALDIASHLQEKNPVQPGIPHFEGMGARFWYDYNFVNRETMDWFLDGATLNNKNFKGFRFIGMAFVNCDFSGSDFSDSVIRNCWFIDCVLFDTKWINTEAESLNFSATGFNKNLIDMRNSHIKFVNDVANMIRTPVFFDNVNVADSTIDSSSNITLDFLGCSFNERTIISDNVMSYFPFRNCEGLIEADFERSLRLRRLSNGFSELSQLERQQANQIENLESASEHLIEQIIILNNKINDLNQRMKD